MTVDERELQRIVVPLDGTLFPLRALVPARLLAASLGVPIELVTVRYGERRVEVEQELRASARNVGIEDVGITIIDDEPVSAGEGVAELVKPHSLVCMTTHARRGVALAAVGQRRARHRPARPPARPARRAVGRRRTSRAPS